MGVIHLVGGFVNIHSEIVTNGLFCCVLGQTSPRAVFPSSLTHYGIVDKLRRDNAAMTCYRKIFRPDEELTRFGNDEALNRFRSRN